MNFLQKVTPRIHTIVLTDNNNAIAYRENEEQMWQNIRNHPTFKERAIDKVDTAIFKTWFSQFEDKLENGSALIVCGSSVVADFPRLQNYKRFVTNSRAGYFYAGDKTGGGPTINDINPSTLFNRVVAYSLMKGITDIIVLGGASVYEQFNGRYSSITKVTAYFDVNEDFGEETKNLHDMLFLDNGNSPDCFVENIEFKGCGVVHIESDGGE